MEYFFKPRSIALIGASKTKGKVGYSLWQKLKAYAKPLYLVNPHFDFKSVRAIKPMVDLAVIAVPAAFVPQVVDDCLAKKVKAVIVISSGFSELGKAGVKLKSPALPMLGPNCFGIANPDVNLDTTFAKVSPPQGNIGFISQSGALASYLFSWAKDEGLGFSKFVSLGNRLNLNENAFLEYLGQDKATKIIALYLESFADGAGWLKIASRVSRRKPVVVLFAGQTPAGRRASRSHTASLSPEDSLVTAALAQSGCLRAKSLTDLTNLLEVFSLEPELKDNDLAIITNAGGPAILAADTAGSLAFDVAQPVDVLGDADAERFSTAFDQVLKDTSQDAFLIIITPQAGTQVESTCAAIVKRFAKVKKPLVVSLLGGKLNEAAHSILKKNGVATIDLPQEAVASLAGLLKFQRQRRRPLYPVRRPYRIIPSITSFSPGRLSWLEAEKLTRKYDLPLVKTKILAKPIRPQDFSWPLVV
ncbi:CoA-binding protein, partial [Patescibacteria group bacterium]|nr:CoA-binding protein [Patescibacteria group bacterium]